MISLPALTPTASSSMDSGGHANRRTKKTPIIAPPFRCITQDFNGLVVTRMQHRTMREQFDEKVSRRAHRASIDSSISGRKPPLGHPGANAAPCGPTRQKENHVLLCVWVDQDIGVVAANMPYELTNSTIGADLLIATPVVTPATSSRFQGMVRLAYEHAAYGQSTVPNLVSNQAHNFFPMRIATVSITLLSLLLLTGCLKTMHPVRASRDIPAGTILQDSDK